MAVWEMRQSRSILQLAAEHNTELDLSELEGLGLVDGPSIKGGQGEKKPKGSQKAQDWEGSDEEAELSEYNSFNYWREPIASIDLLDFNLLL
ncbi:hypothetical protein JZ751_007243 [Albula glossodonta]|uniref:Protein AF1q n=1 Tax=Albula glossodonta TaxID=121402 RepID=A0A8T2NA95_9TELE|nr:hypothetical protein JZ751_007243 [Albula glossodonta]